MGFGAFTAIAFALFAAELTDKDAFFLLTLAAREKASMVFLAGATAFLGTTALFVVAGRVLSDAVPVALIQLFGGSFMLGYAAWQARGARAGAGYGDGAERSLDGWKAFLGVVGALAVLDIAGDATEVLTVVMVAKYADVVLVFVAAYAGLLAATAFETALGSWLGRHLSPRRLRALSVVVFVVLGLWMILSSLA
jgi:putative Ca2+/H+ antiporter (TMEM165/GDT1 family)